MAKSKQRREHVFKKLRKERGSLTAEEAEALFQTVDETGHSDEERAKRERAHRSETGQGVDVDPLSGNDPSGDDVEQHIRKTAVGFVLVFLVAVTLMQVSCGIIRRANTANLSEDVSVLTVASAMRGGVDWGGGFTQFPAEFTVQEADEHTHRIEVTVLDTESGNALDCFSTAQIQAASLSVNALLNPDINTVIYHVNIYVDADGDFRTSRFFEFLRPTGETSSFVTFVWTKSTTTQGRVVFNCTVTGMDAKTQKALRDRITSSHTPYSLITNAITEAPEDELSSAGEKTDGATAGGTSADAAGGEAAGADAAAGNTAGADATVSTAAAPTAAGR